MNNDDKNKKLILFTAAACVMLIVGAIYQSMHPITEEKNAASLKDLIVNNPDDESAASGGLTKELSEGISGIRTEGVADELKKELGFSVDKTDSRKEAYVTVTDECNIVLDGKEYRLGGITITNMDGAVKELRDITESGPVKYETEGDEITIYVLGFSVQQILAEDHLAEKINPK